MEVAIGQTLTPTQPGLYSCRVTAANEAGSTAQASAQLQVSSGSTEPSNKPSNEFTIGKVKKAKLNLTSPRRGRCGSSSTPASPLGEALT